MLENVQLREFWVPENLLYARVRKKKFSHVFRIRAENKNYFSSFKNLLQEIFGKRFLLMKIVLRDKISGFCLAWVELVYEREGIKALKVFTCRKISMTF
jgi:hypothetical protein